MIKNEIKPKKEPTSSFSDSFRNAMKSSGLFVGFVKKYEMTRPEDIAYLIHKDKKKNKKTAFTQSYVFYLLPILGIIALVLYLF